MRLLLLLSFMSVSALHAQTAPLGTWFGTSKCTGARAACRDEQVVYHVSRGATKDHVTVAANKVVDGKEVEMGTLDFRVDTANRRMVADYDSGSVASRWMFTWTDAKMTGTAVMMPSKVVIRNIDLRR